ncbi:MAG: prepilin-type N-terminal cleavage/methylation domain-containing protein [Kiritimatiellia bacterium]
MPVTQNITRRQQEGFTLVEVVVASSVMMLVFVALLSAISFARRVQSFSENRLACLHIARQEMEPYSNYLYDADEFTPKIKYLPGNRGTCEITQVQSEDTRDVTVIINWIEPSGAPYSVELKSSFSRSLHR